MKNYIFGVDRSHLNSKIPLASLVKKNIQFIFFKGSQGLTYVDPTFNAAWQEVKAIPGNLSGQLVKRGVYHFFDPRYDGIAQADHFLSLGVNFNTPGCLPPVVDVEDLFGSDAADTATLNKWVEDNYLLCSARLFNFLNHVKEKTGRDCIIYSYNSYLRDTYHGNVFGNELWLSSLQSTPPKRYDNGQVPLFWQYSYRFEGGDMDADCFTGTTEQFNMLANIL